MRDIEFTRTALGTWAWTADGDVVGSTAYQNPKPAMEAGLELLEAALDDGDVDPDGVRTAVEEARQALSEADEAGEAHRAASRTARRFLEGLDDLVQAGDR